VKRKKFRRHYLDAELSRTDFRGKILDVGGSKTNRRGSFIPPMKNVISWEYLNIDPSAKPDYLCPADKIPLT